MKKHARSLRQDLRRAYDALAFAHAGEMLPDATKDKILAGSTPPAASQPQPGPPPVHRLAPEPHKRIALAIDGRIRLGALRYALGAAARFDAELVILTNLKEADVNAAMVRELGRGAFRWNVLQMGADLLSGIAEHARRDVNTLFVVTSAQDALTERYVATRPSVQVPWLVVSDDLRAA